MPHGCSHDVPGPGQHAAAPVGVTQRQPCSQAPFTQVSAVHPLPSSQSALPVQVGTHWHVGVPVRLVHVLPNGQVPLHAGNVSPHVAAVGVHAHIPPLAVQTSFAVGHAPPHVPSALVPHGVTHKAAGPGQQLEPPLGARHTQACAQALLMQGRPYTRSHRRSRCRSYTRARGTVGYKTRLGSGRAARDRRAPCCTDSRRSRSTSPSVAAVGTSSRRIDSEGRHGRDHTPRSYTSARVCRALPGRRRHAARGRAELVRERASGGGGARLFRTLAGDRVEAAAGRDARPFVQLARACLLPEAVVGVGRPVATADRQRDVRTELRAGGQIPPVFAQLLPRRQSQNSPLPQSASASHTWHGVVVDASGHAWRTSRRTFAVHIVRTCLL